MLFAYVRTVAVEVFGAICAPKVKPEIAKPKQIEMDYPPFEGGQGDVAEDHKVQYVANLKDLDEFVLDDHGHLIVKHDLYNHDGLTGDGIAEAFAEFAKKEGLSFF